MTQTCWVAATPSTSHCARATASCCTTNAPTRRRLTSSRRGTSWRTSRSGGTPTPSRGASPPPVSTTGACACRWVSGGSQGQVEGGLGHQSSKVSVRGCQAWWLCRTVVCSSAMVLVCCEWRRPMTMSFMGQVSGSMFQGAGVRHSDTWVEAAAAKLEW